MVPAKTVEALRESLRWLLLLRNLHIAAVFLLLLIATYGLGLPLPKDPLLGILAIWLALNCFTWYRLQQPDPVRPLELFGHLCGDLISLTALLYFSGGVANPLVWFLLLPLIMTAIILPAPWTVAMFFLSVAAYTFLMAFSLPPPAIPVARPVKSIPELEPFSEPSISLHQFGTWVGFVIGAGLVAYFVTEIATALRKQEQKLREIREKALRNEQVVALGALAASAAHEMGTPLATLKLILEELGEEYREEVDLKEQLELASRQVDRLKEALALLSASAGQLRAEAGQEQPVARYLQDLIEGWHRSHPGIGLRLALKGDPEVVMFADRSLSYALINLLQNAADVSREIEVVARWNERRVTLEIIDRGPGIHPEVAERLGKAAVSTKKQGLGVGTLLSVTIVERLGGRVEWESLREGGTKTTVSWPILKTDGPRGREALAALGG